MGNQATHFQVAPGSKKKAQGKSKYFFLTEWEWKHNIIKECMGLRGYIKKELWGKF